MNSILITGCNRGLGLGMVKKLLESRTPPRSLIATCRDVDGAVALAEIAKRHGNVHILKLELNDLDSFDRFSKSVDEITGDDGLNVLFNSAAFSPKFTRLNLVKSEQLAASFLTNTIAPIMLTKALYPSLKKAATKNADKPMGVQRATVINMSSVLGSLAKNTDGGYYPYRCSKAALNMATRSMAVDFKTDRILVVSLHPGWVKTDMGGPKAPMDIESSTSDVAKLLGNLNEKHNGCFLNHDGTVIDF